jgi:hypothetical protein
MKDKREKAKKKVKVIIALLFFISIILIFGSLISAYKINSEITLLQSCNNCSSCNISKVLYPNSTIFLVNQPMTQNQTSFNYSLSQNYIYVIGEYCWWYECGNSIESATGKICFDVTNTGTTLDASKGIIYILIFVISLLIFAGLMIIGIYLPVSNKKDEMTGYILAVNNLKYFKMICLGFAYLIALFIVYFSWAMSYSFLDLDFVTTILRMIMTIQLVLVLPLFILFTYLTLANAIRDSKIQDLLSRGLRVRD